MPTKVCLVKAMVFPVVIFAVSWTARRSNQSILKEISPEYSLEGLMLKLKIQYFGHLMRRVDSLEKTVMLGGIGGRRRRGRHRMRWLDGITASIDMSLNKLGSWWWTGKLGVLQSMGLQTQTQLSEWTELNFISCTCLWKRLELFSGTGRNPCLILRNYIYIDRYV